MRSRSSADSFFSSLCSQRLTIARSTRTARACRKLNAESTFVPLDDVTLHVVVAGPKHGPLVVLLHGFPECWHTWHHQIPRLVALGYQVIVPDQRGDGSNRPGGAVEG